MQVLTARHETVELVTSLLRGSGAELAAASERLVQCVVRCVVRCRKRHSLAA